tara:strand:+ start:309 stop:533 length:225 start_codon:yes stop_codon:yes gene_type:complete
MEESEDWRKEGQKKPWTEVIETDERSVLQLSARQMGVMFTMLSANLGAKDIEQTRKKCIELSEKFINQWKRIKK